MINHIAIFTHFYARTVGLDLAPAYSFIRPGSSITSVKLIAGVDVDGTFCTVPHETGIGNVMLDYTTTENDHARSLGAYGNSVDLANVFDEIDAKLLRRRLEGVEVKHVSKTAVSESWTEDGYIILPCPVIYRSLIVDLFAEAVDDFAWSPINGVLGSLGSFLFFQHFVQYWNDPVFESAIVVVWNEQIADTIKTFGTKRCTRRGKGAQVSRCKTFDKVFFNTASSRDNCRDVFVLY